MNILILGCMSDGQTGIYLLETCREFSSNVSAIDIRRIIKEIPGKKAQSVIMNEILHLKNTPELIIVMKGVELSIQLLRDIKNKFPKAMVVNWFFDRFLSDKPIWETEIFFESIKLYDIFFCSLKGVADKLNEAGFENAKYLDEACYPPMNGETYMNYFQEKKYGEDISFAGTIGFNKHHPTRIPILSKIIDEGFNVKIWGAIAGDSKHLPTNVKNHHMGVSVINHQHSMVAQASLINLGIDVCTVIELGHSARSYRVMCAGGLYFCPYGNGIEKMFKINKKDEEITGEEEIVVFYNERDMIKKLDFLLEHEDIRKRIAENGKKIVLEKHTFKHRIEEMLKIVKEVKKK